MPARTSVSTEDTAALWVTALQKLGIEPGSVMLFHASFAPMSRQGFLAERVLEAFIRYLQGGTLLAPTLSWREVSPEKPVFDERTTVSNVGILSEVFRVRFAECRSLHPTHSVAGIGPLATRLLATRPRDTRPCGPNSPWGLLPGADATIVMINVDMDTCTLIHHLEENFDPDRYLRDEVEHYHCVGRNDTAVTVGTRRHRKLYRNFWKFRDPLQRRGQYRAIELLGCRIFAFRAADLVVAGSEMFEVDRSASLAAPGEHAKLM